MSWVERCPNARWRAAYRDPTGRKRSQTFDTKAAAKTFLAGVTTDMVRGQWIDPRGGDVPVAEWAQRWLDAPVVRATTLAADRTRLRHHALPVFGHLPLKAVTPPTCGPGWPGCPRPGWPPKTTRHCHALLSTLLADAVTEGLLLANPCQGSRLPTAQRYDARFLTAPEVDRLLAVLDPPERTLVLVALSTGLRSGELAGLRRHRLDLLRRRLHVAETLVEVNGRVSFGAPKTPRSVRTVSLPRQAVDALARHLVGHTDELVHQPRGHPAAAAQLLPSGVEARRRGGGAAAGELISSTERVEHAHCRHSWSGDHEHALPPVPRTPGLRRRCRPERSPDACRETA